MGTPLFLTDETGAITWRREQTPFGNTAFERGTSKEALRFPGQYHDPETGLSYNGFRTYSPALGRYPESDPIGLAGGLNLFVYVENNSVNFIDPLGLIKGNRPFKIDDCNQKDLLYCHEYCAEDGKICDGCYVRYFERYRSMVDNELMPSVYREVVCGCDDNSRNTPNQKEENESTCEDDVNNNLAKAAVAGVATGVTAYWVYRGVRMLPSLIPALWWTIPANLAAL